MFRIVFIFFLLVSPVWADVSGTVRVLDADTFDVGDIRVRVHGIDAPEQDQTCVDAQGARWGCGAFATQQVRDRYQGATATCQQIDRDQYGRVVAKCVVNGEDVGEYIVRMGWARAFRRFSMDYDRVERAAEAASAGLWSSEMIDPSAYRAQQRGAQPRGTDCTIKGNISGSGQIYHMPHNRDYDKTRISEARGERWFCSEAEARAAGWRAARN